jgi:hypothetical protein
MQADVRQLIQAVHDCPIRVMMVTAGAGTQALSELLSVAGATRTLLEAVVPYSAVAFDEFLGKTPDQYVASSTSGLLAGRAFTRARWLAGEERSVVGMACTATIVTDRPKRGEHRAHIGLWQAERLTQHSLHLQKGARDRAGEENVVSRIMLNALAQASGLDSHLPVPLVEGDLEETTVHDFAAVAAKLHRKEIECYGIQDTGRIRAPGEKSPQAILSGAFNPLHDGHLSLAEAAEKMLGHPVTFELSVANADKESLSQVTILDRMAQFAGRWPVFASTAPTFVQKARLYPGSTFVVGYDTAERILQPRYYQDSQDRLAAAMATVDQLGCRFLVAGRVDGNGSFRDLHHLEIPAGYHDLFRSIPPQQFRRDISSTELRETGRKGSR